MFSHLGIIFAVLALLFWTIGDFNIQRSTRAVGDWKSLFFIGAIGGIGIFPFVQGELTGLFQNSQGLLLLTVLSVICLISALFLFEGLKRGKFAVIEPVFGLELPFTVVFSIILGGEHLPFPVYAIIACVFAGLMLTVSKDLKYLHLHRTVFERGVLLAAVGAIGMGLMDFLTGVSSRTLSPLLTIWFMHSFLALSCGLYLWAKGEAKNLWRDLRANRRIILSESLFDNIAWISYAASMALIPISIATAVSESFIALTVLVGVFVNKEKLKRHQFAGAGVVATGLVALALYAG